MNALTRYGSIAHTRVPFSHQFPPLQCILVLGNLSLNIIADSQGIIVDMVVLLAS